MRFLVIQENGRHDANRHFRECFSFKRAFEFHGHECDVWGLGHENFDERPDFKVYDCIINLEQYDNIGWVPNDEIARSSATKFLWATESHISNVWINIDNEFNYDFVLQPASEMIKRDKELWFANAIDEELIYPMKDIEKSIRFGFCGTFGTNIRRSIIENLSAHYELKKDIFVIGEDMVKAINSYLCHFNYNIGFGYTSSVNYRVFETIACGTLLMTSYSQDYETLGLKHGENCLVYSDEASLIENVNFILEDSNTDACVSMANSGLELSRKHTYKERVKIILEKLV